MVTAGLFLIPAVLPATEAWLIRGTLQSLALARIVLPSSVQVLGSTFVVGPTRIQIVPDCTPMFPTLLVIGGILAFPAPWRSKVVGVGAIGATLWLYNMLRIYILMAVLRFAPRQFDLVHVYLWQSVTLLVVVGSFALWVRALGARQQAA